MKKLERFFKETYTLTKGTMMSVMFALMLTASLATLGLEAECNKNNTIVVEAGYDYESEIAELEAEIADLKDTIKTLEGMNENINKDREFYIELANILEDENEELHARLEEEQYLVDVAYCALWRVDEITIDHVDAWFGAMHELIDEHYIERTECIDGTWTRINNALEYYDICETLDSCREELVLTIAEEGYISELTFANMMRLPERISEEITEVIPGFEYLGGDFWNVISPYLGR